jgi:adenosylhomocysteine nucleosidase
MLAYSFSLLIFAFQTMLVIISAHHREALAIIEKYDLKQNRNFSARPVFESSSVRLVISGMGSINAAIATTLAFSDLNPLHVHAAVNFGICAGNKTLPLSELFQVNRILSPSLKKSWYPDMILKLGFPESGLETHEHAYIDSESPPLTMELVDMEAAGFFEAARTFVAPSRIFVLKLLSDFGARFEDIKPQIDNLISSQQTALMSALDAILDWLQRCVEPSKEELHLIEKVQKSLALSESQYQQLLFLCRARVSIGDTQQILNSFLNNGPINKQTRNKIFSEISDALKLPLI